MKFKLNFIIKIDNKKLRYIMSLENVCVHDNRLTTKQFFQNIKKYDNPIAIFDEFCGIQGFTLAYGNFCYKEFLDDDIISDTEKEDSFDIVRKNFRTYRKLFHKNINVYHMPCCWNRKTKFNCFVGVSIYPLIWSDNRQYWKEIKDENGHTKLVLESAMDRWIMTRDKKEEILKKLSEYNAYQLPKCIEVEVNNIKNEFYSERLDYKKYLYLSSYSTNEKWKDILNKTFNDVIEKYSGIIRDETGEQGVFCMVPNDCFTCT